MTEIGQQIYDAKVTGKTNAELATLFDLNERTIRRLAQEYASEFGLPWPVSVNQSLRLVNSVSNNHMLDGRYGQRQWETFISEFPDRYMKIMIINDIHFPNHEPAVLDILVKLAHDFQPHIINDGSDIFEHENVGRWPVSTEKKLVNFWSQTKHDYQVWRERLLSAAPNHRSFFLVGNHDTRMLNYVRDNMPQIREAVEQDFFDTITDTGTWWLGENVDAVSIDNFFITHGTGLASRAPATSLWNKIGYNFSVSVAGHVHRRSYYEHSAVAPLPNRKGFAVRKSEAYTTGCACKLTPAYKEESTVLVENWSWGCGLCILDRKTGAIYFDNLDIKSDATVMWGGTIYTS